MNQITCLSEEQLRDYILGKLPEDVAEQTEQHLQVCQACEATVEGLETQVDSLVEQIRQPPSDDPYLAEPQCQEVVVRAKLLAGKVVSGAGQPKDPAPSQPASQPISLGRLGEYELLAKLGEGGMGAVYKARQTRLKKIVALKVLPKERTADPRAVTRFEREMEAVGQLSHPNIVQAYDARDIDATTVLVMEYVDGKDLGELLKCVKSLPIADACELVCQAALGLQYAHENGLVHRDIKPSNLMLTTLPSPFGRGAAASLPTPVPGRGAAASLPSPAPGSGAAASLPSPVPGGGAAASLPSPACRTRQDGRGAGGEGRVGIVKILDLGLALLGTDKPGRGELTTTGAAMGTADYMAPEQVSDARSVDIRADIYGLGCTLYKLLTSQSPFSGPQYTTHAEKMVGHLKETPPPVQSLRADVPAGLAAVIERMMAKRPDDRFATPADVAAAIAPFAAGCDLARVSAEATATAGNAVARDKSLAATGPHASSAVVATDANGASAPLARRGRGAGGEGRAIRRRLGVRGLVATALAFSAIALGVLFTLRTSEGTLVIETDDPNVQVAVKQNGEVVEVADAKSGWKISLKSGQYGLSPQGSTDQFQLDQDSVVVKRGDTVKVKVTLKPSNSPRPLAGEGQGVRVAGAPPPPAIAPFDAKKAKEHQEAWAKHLGVPVELMNSIGMKLVLIPPGEFEMGSPKELIEEELKAHGDDEGYMQNLRAEAPQHHVRITRPFYLGACDVTQEEYQRVMATNPSDFSGTGRMKQRVAGLDTKRFPVEMVSWDDAVEFCNRLCEAPVESAAERQYRLPTEAHWEYACRAGSTGRYGFSLGNKVSKASEEQELLDYGWLTGNSGDRTHAVGGRRRGNAWGLSDVHGNVWQWCQDWYGADYYAKSPVDDPTGPSTGSDRVTRGGSWYDWAGYCRAALRGHGVLGSRGYGLGFRVCLLVPDTAAERAKMSPSNEAAPSSTGSTTLKQSPAVAGPDAQSAVRYPALGSPNGADGKWQLPPGAPLPAIAPFDAEKAKEHQEAWAKHLGVPVELMNSIGMKLVLIPPGEFEMGSPKELIEEELKAHGDEQSYKDYLPGEGPQHRVRIIKPFYLGAYDVTQGEYEKVMGNNPSEFSAAGKQKDKVSGKNTKRFPVECVPWDAAVDFCRKLSERSEEKAAGRWYRLPSEAQWEYACRAGNTGRFSFSRNNTTMPKEYDEHGLEYYGWFANNSGGMPHAVGLKRGNPWGLYDMHGNIWQWCQDLYDKNWYAVTSQDDPSGPLGGSNRVTRGGCSFSLASDCRSAVRFEGGPGNSCGAQGFRVSLLVPDSAAERANLSSHSQSVRDRHAAEWVIKLGGSLEISVNGVEADVKALDDLPDEKFVVVEISLDGNQGVTSEDIENLAGLTSLWSLSFPVTKATVSCLPCLKGLKGLKTLGLGRISDDQLAYLSDLTELQVLSAMGSQITDAGLDHLKTLNQLESLNLWGNPVTGAAFATPSGLSKLKYLQLTGPQITDDSLKGLRSLKALERLVLEDSGITGPGLEHLKALKKLRILDLSNSRLTSEGLEYLRGFTELQDLNLGATKFNAADIAKLQSALPNCKIYVDPAIQTELNKIKAYSPARQAGRGRTH